MSFYNFYPKEINIQPNPYYEAGNAMPHLGPHRPESGLYSWASAWRHLLPADMAALGTTFISEPNLYAIPSLTTPSMAGDISMIFSKSTPAYIPSIVPTLPREPVPVHQVITNPVSVNVTRTISNSKHIQVYVNQVASEPARLRKRRHARRPVAKHVSKHVSHIVSKSKHKRAYIHRAVSKPAPLRKRVHIHRVASKSAHMRKPTHIHREIAKHAPVHIVPRHAPVVVPKHEPVHVKKSEPVLVIPMIAKPEPAPILPVVAKPEPTPIPQVISNYAQAQVSQVTVSSYERTQISQPLSVHGQAPKKENIISRTYRTRVVRYASVLTGFLSQRLSLGKDSKNGPKIDN